MEMERKYDPMKTTPTAEPESVYLKAAVFKSTLPSRNGGPERNSTERNYSVSAPKNTHAIHPAS
jgi:hypothetical protein